MWRSKKVILIAVTAAIVLAAGIGGAVYAKTSTAATANPVLNLAANATSGNDTLLARVAKILGIDQTKLQDAVKQAKGDMQNDKLNKYLQNLVTKGTITQAQADSFKTWWQSKPTASSTIQQFKDWLAAKPADVPLPRGFAGPGFCGGPVRGAGPARGGSPVRGMMGRF